MLRLSARGAHHGHRLFPEATGAVVGIPATADRGHTVLERRLLELAVAVGDQISSRYLGKRTTANGECSYRLYEVEVEDAR